MKRHRRHHRHAIVHHYPYYGYGYPYPYYNRYPYYDYDKYREPTYIVRERAPASESQNVNKLSLQIPTIAVSLLLSYLLWGRGGA